jgi:hypothetical protein
MGSLIILHCSAGPYATWIVSPHNGHLRLQNLAHPERYLAIRDNTLTWGPGGIVWCRAGFLCF